MWFLCNKNCQVHVKNLNFVAGITRRFVLAKRLIRYFSNSSKLVEHCAQSPIREVKMLVVWPSQSCLNCAYFCNGQWCLNILDSCKFSFVMFYLQQVAAAQDGLLLFWYLWWHATETAFGQSSSEFILSYITYNAAIAELPVFSTRAGLK